MERQPHVSGRLRFDDFELDARTGELRRKGVRLRLRGQPLRVLEILLERAGDVVTREELQSRIWPADTFVDFDHSLHNAIARIREVLGDSAEKPRYIETLPRLGYRYIGPAEMVSAAATHTVNGNDAQMTALGSKVSADPLEGNRTGRRIQRWLLLAACLVPLAIVGMWLLHRYRPAAPPIRSLAVMPLEDLSPGTREQYFADGMTDELITELAQIPGLRIVSRTSVMQDQGTRKPLAQIARELNVDALVEGTVVRSGDRVRITAQLIDARNDNHLWAQTFEGSLGDVLSLQDNVAREIASQTETALTTTARAQLTNPKPVTPEAHDAYLRGLYFINRREGLLATSYFRKAIALDPKYAAAHAGLAEALVTQFISGEGSAEEMPSAIAAAHRAIELDPYGGEAYTALGAIDTCFLWDWDAAEKNLRRGIALSPSNSHAENWLAYFLMAVGRAAEAVEATQRAVSLDPLSFWANRNLGMALYYARRYDESLAALNRASELAPDRPEFVGIWKSADYEIKGSYAEAVGADLKQFIHLLSQADVDSLRSAFETGGWKGYQADRVKLLTRRTPNDTGLWDSIALSYLRLGNITEAFHWFNREADEHSPYLLFLQVDPRTDNIRNDPRYAALLSRMSLPHGA